MTNNQLIKTLRDFSSQTNKFDQHKQFFTNVKTEIDFEQDRGTKVTLSGVQEENLISVLTHFRVFYMKKSRFNFIKITKQILAEEELTTHHASTTQLLTVWKKLLSPDYGWFGGLLLQTDSQKLSLKKNLDIWLNEGYFHADEYQEGSLKGLDQIKSQHVFESLSKLGFIDTIQRLAALIIAFNAQVVEKILEPMS